MCSGAMYGSVPPIAARSGRPSELHVLGQVEVEQHRPAVVGQEDVGRLEVAVQDSAAMGMAQSVGELTAEREDRLDVGQTLPDATSRRAPPVRDRSAAGRQRTDSCARAHG